MNNFPPVNSPQPMQEHRIDIDNADSYADSGEGESRLSRCLWGWLASFFESFTFLWARDVEVAPRFDMENFEHPPEGNHSCNGSGNSETFDYMGQTRNLVVFIRKVKEGKLGNEVPLTVIRWSHGKLTKPQPLSTIAEEEITQISENTHLHRTSWFYTYTWDEHSGQMKVAIYVAVLFLGPDCDSEKQELLKWYKAARNKHDELAKQTHTERSALGKAN